MSITADSLTGLTPLRAKSGWIIALGVVYLIAGFIPWERSFCDRCDRSRRRHHDDYLGCR